MIDRIPILQLGDLLLVSIQVDLHDHLALRLQEDITSEIAAHHPRGVLLDISGLDVVDSFIGRVLVTIAAAARVLGTNAVVVGMRPAVAMTLVELGLSLKGVHTALNVDRGVALLRRLAESAVAGAPGGTRRRLDGPFYPRG